jgi:hypothetical protein
MDIPEHIDPPTTVKFYTVNLLFGCDIPADTDPLIYSKKALYSGAY